MKITRMCKCELSLSAIQKSKKKKVKNPERIIDQVVLNLEIGIYRHLKVFIRKWRNRRLVSYEILILIAVSDQEMVKEVSEEFLEEKKMTYSYLYCSKIKRTTKKYKSNSKTIANLA